MENQESAEELPEWEHRIQSSDVDQRIHSDVPCRGIPGDDRRRSEQETEASDGFVFPQNTNADRMASGKADLDRILRRRLCVCKMRKRCHFADCFVSESSAFVVAQSLLILHCVAVVHIPVYYF